MGRKGGRRSGLALDVDPEVKTGQVNGRLGRQGIPRALGHWVPPLHSVAFLSGDGALWKALEFAHRSTQGGQTPLLSVYS